ncbi:MAG: peptidylprolyl isomerase [Bacteroidales bacterium]|nr:peptidylprolyl isomerase [Bacteroidales bacterium]
MKRYFILISLLIMGLFFTGCKNSPKETEEPKAEVVEQTISQTVDINAPIAEEPVLLIKTSMGDITVKLYKETPLHRDNFVKLARSGFYNGLLFHRVIPGFMIQGGDPFTKDKTKEAQYGTGGPGYTIPAEIVPGKTHKKGALAAARRGDSVNPAKESSGSQFYLVQDAEGCKHLDGQYTIFGEALSGLDVIDSIAAVERNNRDLPLTPVKIISISEVK